MNDAFERQVTVRWRDTDALGHVNHAVFLTYLEEGRDAFYARVLGSEPIYVVARLEIDFRAEVRPAEEQVLVRIEVERLGTTSLTTRETLLNSAGEVAAQARVVTVRWDEDRRIPIPFSAEERERLTTASVRRGPLEVQVGRAGVRKVTGRWPPRPSGGSSRPSSNTRLHAAAGPLLLHWNSLLLRYDDYPRTSPKFCPK